MENKNKKACWLVLAALALGSCAIQVDESTRVLRERSAALFGTVQPVSEAEVAAPQAVLGRALFWDTRLSLDGKTACASCHARADWSADRRPLSINAKGEPTTLHSQPMFMAQDQTALRWYGDRKDGSHQAEKSITGSMGMPTAQAMVPLLDKYNYGAMFKVAFPEQAEPLSPANYAKALQAYERTLRTPAPFDDFLRGDHAALTPLQLEGLDRFMASGCIACHSGPLLGGNSLRKFGLVKDYWLATRSARVDEGLFTVTKQPDDKYVFRVAMLRNIEKTSPYFHDGSVASLDRAVRVMAEVQLGRTLPDKDVLAIVAFLGSLTGALPAHYAPPVATSVAAR